MISLNVFICATLTLGQLHILMTPTVETDARKISALIVARNYMELLRCFHLPSIYVIFQWVHHHPHAITTSWHWCKLAPPLLSGTQSTLQWKHRTQLQSRLRPSKNLFFDFFAFVLLLRKNEKQTLTICKSSAICLFLFLPSFALVLRIEHGKFKCELLDTNMNMNMNMNLNYYWASLYELASSKENITTNCL